MLTEFFDEILKQIVILLPESSFFSRIRYRYYKNKLKKCEYFNSLPLFRIYGPENITIGKDCAFNYNVTLNASGGGIINIGDNVLVGPNVVIRAADHNFEDPNLDIDKQGHIAGKIEINNNVWIGANVVITKGVNIGEGCVIGAGAVVTRDIPPYSVAAGVPARVIRERK